MAIRTQRAKGGTVGLGGNYKLPFETTYFELNMADVAADVAAGTFVSADQYVVMTIPAHTGIVGIQAVVVNALSLGAGARIDIGDSAAATTFVNNAATLTAGTVLTQAVTTNPLKYYAAADQLLLKITGGTIASGIIRITVMSYDNLRNAPMTVQS